MPMHIMNTISIFAFMALFTLASAVLMKPMRFADYEQTIGLHRRAMSDFADLVLQNHSELIYHGVSTAGEHHLANLMLYAPTDLPIITMERFGGLTSLVNCNADDGSIALTFESEEAYKVALHEWAYINEKDDDRFVLIADHVSCLLNGDRQPFVVSNVVEDGTTLTTHLQAHPVPWSTIAGSYDLSVGHIIPLPPSNNSLSRRHGHGWHDCLDGDCDPTEDFIIPFHIGKPKQRTKIVDEKIKLTSSTKSIDAFSLYCVDCYTTGNFKVAASAKIKDYHIEDLYLTVTPQDVLAKLEMEAKFTYSGKPDEWKDTRESQKIPIPDAGLVIPHFITIGANIYTEVGIGITYKGSVDVIFGVEAKIPEEAMFTYDHHNADKSKATGWFEAGQVTPMLNVTSATGSISLDVWHRPKLAFTVEIEHVEKTEFSLQMKLPVVSETFTAGYDESGWCKNNDDEDPIKQGVKVDKKVGFSLDLAGEMKVKKVKKGMTLNLYSTATTIATACLPIGTTAEATATAEPDAARR